MEQDWFYLGPCATNNAKQKTHGLIVKEIVPGTLADIVDWELIWSNAGAFNRNSYSLWRGVPASPDYVVLGDFFVRSSDPPTAEECKGMKAVHRDACVVASFGERIWKDSGSGAKKDGSVWDISNGRNKDSLPSGVFIATAQHNQPETTPFAINAKKVWQQKS